MLPFMKTKNGLTAWDAFCGIQMFTIQNLIFFSSVKYFIENKKNLIKIFPFENI